MDDEELRELAEKVAERLGWELVGNTYNYKEDHPDWHPEVNFVRAQFDQMSISITPDNLNSEIFSWPTFGLIIEDAEKRGWRILWDTAVIQFHNNRQEDDPDYIGTMEYFTTEHGIIKATALAFLETFK